MNKIYKFLILFILFIGVSGCSAQINSNDYFEEKFNMNLENLNFIKVNYSEFKKIVEDKNRKSFLLVLRDDCQVCHDFLVELNGYVVDTDNKIDIIYVLESNNLTEEEKNEFVSNYAVSSVPLIMISKEGKIFSIDVGVPNFNRLSKIISEYKS